MPLKSCAWCAEQRATHGECECCGEPTCDTCAVNDVPGHYVYMCPSCAEAEREYREGLEAELAEDADADL